MTNKELFKEIGKLEQILDTLLEESLAVLDDNEYQLLRYYFSQSNYEKMLEILERRK